MILSKCITSKNKTTSAQNLADYELSNIEKSDIVNHTLNTSALNSTISNENHQTKEQIHENCINKDEYTYDDYLRLMTNLYKVFIHIFIFSLFESLFFWFYITKKEDQAILNQIDDVILVGNIFCSNIKNDDIDFSSLYSYQKEERDDYNEKLPLNNTVMLNGYLFCIIILLNVIMKFSKVHVMRINYRVLKQQSVTFIFLFLYEYLFFKSIIYNYVPNSSNKIIRKIFEKCI